MKLKDLIPKSIRIALQEIAAPKQATQEIGVGYEASQGSVMEEVENTDKLKAQDYENMQTNDGEVSAIVSLLSLPIQSAGVEIVAHEDDKNEEVADFIRDNLMNPPYTGGMDISMPVVLQDMTRGLAEGFRVYEKVFELQDGKYILKRLSPRSAKTLTVRTDDNGYFDGVTQKVSYKGAWKEVIIPKDKCVHLVFNRKHDWNYGRSVLKAAWYHYHIKHKLLYLANKQAEIGTFKSKMIFPNVNFSPEDKTALKKAMKSLGMKSSTVIFPDSPDSKTKSAEVIFEEPTTKMDIKALIEYQDQQIAKSVLAQFIELGTGANVGSWALSKDHSDLFLMSIKSYMSTIEDAINTDIIAPLVDINFGNNLYPKFQFDDLTRERTGLIKEIFINTLQRADIIPPEGFIREVYRDAADVLNVNWTPEQQEKEDKKKEKEKVEPPTQVPIPQIPPEKLPETIPPKFAEAKKKFWRKPTRFEEKLGLDEMDDKWEKAKVTYEADLQKILDSQKESYSKTGEFDAKDFYMAVVSRMGAMVTFGKDAAAKELGKISPPTDKEAIKQVKDQAKLAADKFTAELEKGGKIAVEKLSMVDKFDKASVGNTIASIGGEGLSKIEILKRFYEKYIEKRLKPFVDLFIAGGVNTGKDTTYSKYKNDISRYEYSAILDDRTCFKKNTKIKILGGDKYIQDIKIGDKVLTRKGYQKVYNTMVKKYNGEMVKLKVRNEIIECTSDHEFYILGQGWKEAKDLRIGDKVVNSFLNKLLGKFLVFRDNLGKSDYRKSIFFKEFIFSTISILYAKFIMPIFTIGFNNNLKFRQIEINGKSTNLNFLDKFNFKFLQNNSNKSFQRRFPPIFSITGKRTKSSSFFHSWLNPKLLTTVDAGNDQRRPSTYFRTIMSVRRTCKDFTASFAFYIMSLFSTTLTGTESISLGIIGINRKRFFAFWANLCNLIGFYLAKIAFWGTILFRPSLRRIKSFIANRTFLKHPVPSDIKIAIARTIFLFAKRSIKFFTTRIANFYHNNLLSSIDYIGKYQGCKVIVYNLSVENDPVYFANGVLVHNCPYCEELDRKVVEVDSPEYEEYMPSQHFSCRCQWIGILDSEVDPPEITGIPENLPAMDIDEFEIPEHLKQIANE